MRSPTIVRTAMTYAGKVANDHTACATANGIVARSAATNRNGGGYSHA